LTSREKVLRLKDWLYGLKPEDESSAQMLQLLVAGSPLLMKAIPDDPLELDRYLRMIAWASVRCRSDDAAELGVFELVDGKWEPVEIEVEG
jgi:hypothetical protein